MAYDFFPWDHGPQFLVPPDVRDWLPDDHGAWALLEAAGLLGLLSVSGPPS